MSSRDYARLFASPEYQQDLKEERDAALQASYAAYMRMLRDLKVKPDEEDEAAQ